MDQEAVVTEIPSMPPATWMERGSDQGRDEPSIPVWEDDFELNEIVSSQEKDKLFHHMFLTSRQKDVLALILMGNGDRQISEILGIKIGTVSVLMRNMFRKYQVNSRVQMILLFFRELRRQRHWEIHAPLGDEHECDCPYLSRKRPEDKSRQIMNEIWPEFEPILVSINQQQGARWSLTKEKNYFYALVYESLTGIRWGKPRPAYFPCHQALQLRLKAWLGSRQFCETWHKVVTQYSLIYGPNPGFHAECDRKVNNSNVVPESSTGHKAQAALHPSIISEWSAAR